MRDVHPLGNPHFSLDPGLAPIITQNIVDGLARVAPENRAAFESNRKAFLAQLDQRMAEWTKLMAPVKGGKVYWRWPGLAQSQLYEGRDLAVTTDFRQVLGEAVYKHLGNKALNQVFPGFENQPGKFLKYLG